MLQLLLEDSRPSLLLARCVNSFDALSARERCVLLDPSRVLYLHACWGGVCAYHCRITAV